MSALIELRNVRKRYRRRSRRSATSRSSLPEDAAVDDGDRRRKRQRQDHAGPDLLLGFIPPTQGQVLYRGQDLAAMSGAEQRQFRREVQPIFQDPFDVFNPFYRVDHVLDTPLRRFGLAASPRRGARDDRGRAAAGRPAAGRHARALSARAQRRPAPADHGGPRGAAPPADHRRRRAGVDGRRLAPGHDPRRAAHAEPRPRHLDRLHHPRPHHRLPDLRRHHDPLPGRGRRGRLGRARHPRSEAPLHPAPRLLDPAPRPLAEMGHARRPCEQAAGPRRRPAATSRRVARTPWTSAARARRPGSSPTPSGSPAASSTRATRSLADDDLASVFRPASHVEPDPVAAARTDFSRQKAGFRE